VKEDSVPAYSSLLYLLTDGGHARLVRRAEATGHYVTVEEIDGAERLAKLREELRASLPARTFSKGSPRRRSAIGPEDYIRPAKEAFAAEVADHAVEVARREQLAGIFVAAPARLLGPLKVRLDQQVPVTGALRKDLTKAPDQELGAWLDVSLGRRVSH
jgi:protein required for attachment to host cells